MQELSSLCVLGASAVSVPTNSPRRANYERVVLMFAETNLKCQNCETPVAAADELCGSAAPSYCIAGYFSV